MEDLVKQLEQLGLQEKEAGIYTAILMLGQGDISDISRKSGVRRTTVYQYLGDLEKKRLVAKTVRGKRTEYIPEKPERIVKMLESKRKQAEKILPELQSLFSRSSGRPNVRFYEGKEGMREIYREMTKTSQTLWAVFSADAYNKVFSVRDGDEFIANIKERGGILKDLVEDTPEGREYVKMDLNKGFGGSKLLPENFEITSDVLVAGDKLAMNSMTRLVGVIVENPEIAEMQRNFIKFLWRHGRSLR